MQSIENKIFSRIKGSGRGYIFSATDFVDKFNSSTIDWALANLVQSGKIRRLMRGIYDFPKYSTLLEQYLNPEIDKLAYALAKKFNWRIAPSGDTALNLLGLSTQVPGRYIYLSDGPSRQYEFLGNKIEFKKTASKNIGFKYPDSTLLVQALTALGKKNINNNIIQKLKLKIDSKLYDKISSDTKTVNDWVYKIIKQICSK